uniref:aldose epimerase family protein n=1 Tax=Candidatus Stercorousia sp. TaxID=3048886 RepID=UPI0040270661
MILKNNYLEVEISEFGASIISIKTPNNKGEVVDVVLGYDDIEKYKRQTKYIGATVGRYCNRIKNGLIEIDGTKYQLNCNDGKNHLHGGDIGFDKKIWNSKEIENGVELTYISEDGEENYPGQLDVKVIYTLKENSLVINYKATTNKTTICNLTNHTYFNLNGYGNILQHQVQILAAYFTENNQESIPTGKIIPVENTPMDFRNPQYIEKDINNEYYQIKYAKGFDNNWVLNNYNGEIRKIATAYSELSGIELEVSTDLPGIQFYSGNFLDGAENGKNNIPIKNHSGFCLECQYFPDAFNHKNFPQPVLKKGEVYNKTIEYKFNVKHQSL